MVAESLEARVASLTARRGTTRDDRQSYRGWDLAAMAVALRWGAMCFAAVSAFSPFGPAAGRDMRRDAIGSAVLVAYGVARTIHPIRSAPRRVAMVSLCTEAALSATLALLTGAWSSPLLLMVGSALLIAGLLAGMSGLGVSLAAVLAVVGVGELAGTLHLLQGVRSAIAWQRIPELVLMGAIGTYAHRLFYSEDRAYNRLRWMNEIHGLLLELYGLATEHPGLFTVEGAVNATVARLREVLPSDALVLLLRQPTAEGLEQPWEVAYHEGMDIGAHLASDDLPAELRACVETRRTALLQGLEGTGGFDPGSTSGLCAPILARGGVIGLVALERRHPPGFGADSRELLEEIARHAGLAIDNARSFLRLRNLGAEEERERIARELHDRVGQSLAAAAFNIDRITASLPAGAPDGLGSELETLSREIRAVSGEIREKLAELRGGPTASLDVVRLLGDTLARVETRSTMKVSFDHDLERRLPDIVEREIWRIACEAIRNVERHAGASRLAVSLRSDVDATVLEVSDDGHGIRANAALRTDAYGIVGMRERADLLDATLVVDSAPQRGTTVRLRVPHR